MFVAFPECVEVFFTFHNIRFFAKSKGYYFDIDVVRIPYDAETKKVRTRSIFVGSKWLEIGYNPKDVWSVSRLHRQHAKREKTLQHKNRYRLLKRW